MKLMVSCSNCVCYEYVSLERLAEFFTDEVEMRCPHCDIRTSDIVLYCDKIKDRIDIIIRGNKKQEDNNNVK
jgi:hypothetical protein